ncbi:MAG: hypothetical protein RMJ37_03840 [Spirochaetia bacterium]|nr:hypothetical protein [Spirochaetota bacterium]MCX8096900.1 hypothetical protein [Spirochaetota bacterium]MDW8112459.1 hypothetical protein [Spirochaetia bacterium]
MKNKIVKVVMIFLVFAVLTSTAHSVEVAIGLGMPFYRDGIGIMTDFVVRDGMYEFFKVDLPIYLGGGLSFHYARGSDNDYYVDMIDFGFLLSGEYLLIFDKINLGFGLDLYFSYSSAFNNLSSLGSLGANFRPNLTSTYSFSRSLKLGAKFGYNVGIYTSYRGYIFFELLTLLKI